MDNSCNSWQLKEKNNIYRVKFIIHIFSQIVLFTLHLRFYCNKISRKQQTDLHFYQERKHHTLLFKVRKHFISPRLIFPAGEMKNAACVNQTVSTSILSKYQCRHRHLLTKLAIMQIQNLITKGTLESWWVLNSFVQQKKEKMMVQDLKIRGRKRPREEYDSS